MSDGRAMTLERLRHMLEAAEAITEYVGRGRTVFDGDPAVRDAILYQIIVLGEAAKAAIVEEPGLTAALPAVDFSPLARMRDRVAHHYWATDRDVVWATAAEAVPALQGALVEALARYT